MAERGRLANALLLSAALATAGVLVLYPVIGAIVWQRADARSLDVVVYNTTVASEGRLQQRAVDLVLEHLKVEQPRFVGAAPGGIDIGQWPESPPEIVFLVDAYGVYLDDPDTDEVTLLTRPLGDPIAPDLEAWVAGGTFVYGEFNVLHQPTPADVSERFQTLFGIDATGWVGRWYSNLDEVGGTLRDLADEPLPSGEPGLILVSQSVGDRENDPRMIVISGPDLADRPPLITGRTPDGRELGSAPMLDWFSLVLPEEPGEVLMWLELPVTGSAVDRLADAGISVQTSMLILGESTAYFAGNMSRTAARFPTRGIAGALDVMRVLPQSRDAAAFYRVVGPTLEWIVESGSD